jgi:Dyp-type peroxidase family
VVSLDLKDIQGNILQGYGFPSANYLFFEIPDAGSGRGFLGEIVGTVRNAEQWAVAPQTVTNVALTYAGLRALELDDRVLCELPDAFREPMRERAARVLGDTGHSAPEEWKNELGTRASHLLVAVNASAGNELKPFDDALDDVRSRAAQHGLRLLHEQPARPLDNRREHFGWADGFGQPWIEGGTGIPRPGQGVPQDDGITWRALKAGEFVLGYPDEDGQTIGGRAEWLLANGSFMVYRKLYQDVAAFRRGLYLEAARYGRTVRPQPPMDGDQLYELMAAKVVGRWRDGVAIELVERRVEPDSRALGGRAQGDPDNDFRYYQADASGYRCPKGAHIRRTNPRDALGWGGKMTTRHRIIRRGMPYGPFLEGLDDDKKDRGLIFICFNADFARQFEVVQEQWCNDGNAFGLGDDRDYLLGDDRGTGKVTIQGDPPHFAKAQPSVVLTRGCEYLLMPGIRALRRLAEGQ